MKTYQPFIAYSRGFAITTIVLYHVLRHTPLPGFLGKAIALGGAGVHLFFFFSGYGLVASRYAGAKEFIVRRFQKILLPYYLIITTIFLLNISLNVYKDGFYEYLGHIFLFKMFSTSINSFGGQFWYMSTLIQFYLCFPLILFLVNSSKPKFALFIAIGLSLSYGGWVAYMGQEEERHYNSFFFQYLWEFVLGMLLYKTEMLQKLIERPIWQYFMVIAVGYSIMGILVLKFGSIGKIYNDYFSFMAYFSVCVVAYRSRFMIKFFDSIDAFSYTLYLTHYFVIDLYRKLISEMPNYNYHDAFIVILLTYLLGYYTNEVMKKVFSKGKQAVPRSI
ncbi:acyltransferase [Spirosoma sp. RP8]|uniref:Acyltransferase n=1 Tax=Spirosoma liriopis TaxID=2937440 RepID=A0ABT0HPI8_9BACT|nr:acyltransferase [Spirosoma liriopis]MCK8493762.1 acyltransferase [Spirosoma liriopis]